MLGLRKGQCNAGGVFGRGVVAGQELGGKVVGLYKPEGISSVSAPCNWHWAALRTRQRVSMTVGVSCVGAHKYFSLRWAAVFTDTRIAEVGLRAAGRRWAVMLASGLGVAATFISPVCALLSGRNVQGLVGPGDAMP